MSFPAIDFIFLLVTVIFGFIGLFNGFINELFGKIVPVISIWVAFVFCGFLVQPLSGVIHIHFLAVVLSFLIVFVASFLVLKIIQQVIKAIFDCEIFKSLDRFLGFVLGLVEGLALVCVILIVMYAQPWFDVAPVLKGSLFASILNPVLSVPLSSVHAAVANHSFFGK
ncbi:MAG: CvpA family protein [Treponema sp.]|nr:CvpA family protein [Treponema sp.]